MAIGVALWNSSASIPALRERKLHIIVEDLSGAIVTCAFSQLGYTENPRDLGDGVGDLAKGNLLLLCWLSSIGVLQRDLFPIVVKLIESDANLFTLDWSGAGEDLDGAMPMRGTVGDVICV